MTEDAKDRGPSCVVPPPGSGLERAAQEKLIDESPLALGYRAELQKLLQAPLTAKRLAKIASLTESVARAVRQVEGKTEARRRAFGTALNPVNPVYMGNTNANEEANEEEEPVDGQGLSFATNSETYGATIVRELIAAASRHLSGGQKTEDPVKIVQAIIQARQAGLFDLETELRLKLGISTLPDAKPVTPKEHSPEASS